MAISVIFNVLSVLLLLAGGVSTWVIYTKNIEKDMDNLRNDLRVEVTDHAVDQIGAVLTNSEAITALNARNFRSGVFSMPTTLDDPRKTQAVLFFMNAFLQQMYASMTVTTVSMTTHRGILFGVYNDYNFTFSGQWQSYIDAQNRIVLQDYATVQRGMPNEGDVTYLVAQEGNYNSSQQVWYTVVNTADPNGEAWTPIYTMAVNGGAVTTMLSHSRVAWDTYGRVIGVVTIDLALGFVSRLLQSLPLNNVAKSFVVDANAGPHGAVLGAAGTTEAMSMCVGTKKADNTCNGTVTFLPPRNSTTAFIFEVDNYVATTYGGWKLLTGPLTVNIGKDHVMVRQIKRTGLNWWVAVVVQENEDLKQMTIAKVTAGIMGAAMLFQILAAAFVPRGKASRSAKKIDENMIYE